MKALVQEDIGKLKLADVPLPDLRAKPSYILVKVEYVALNPSMLTSRH